MTIWHTGADGMVEAFNVDLVLMTMQASQCPVLVRRDPDGDWWVIAQGPPGVLHAHSIHPHAAWLGGHDNTFDAALDQAQQCAAPWRARAARQQDRDREPEMLRTVLDRLFESFSNHHTDEEGHPE